MSSYYRFFNQNDEIPIIIPILNTINSMRMTAGVVNVIIV